MGEGDRTIGGTRIIGVIGTGVIGTGWAVRALSRGLDVLAWDPAPDAEPRLRAAVERAWPAAVRLGLFPGADPSRLTWATTAGAVSYTHLTLPTILLV